MSPFSQWEQIGVNMLYHFAIAHSSAIKEEYETIALILLKIKYQEHRWRIYVDLPMVNFLLEQQGGYTKCSRF